MLSTISSMIPGVSGPRNFAAAGLSAIGASGMASKVATGPMQSLLELKEGRFSLESLGKLSGMEDGAQGAGLEQLQGMLGGAEGSGVGGLSQAMELAEKLGIEIPGGEGTAELLENLGPVTDLLGKSGLDGAAAESSIGGNGSGAVADLLSGDLSGLAGVDMEQMLGTLVEEVPMAEQIAEMASQSGVDLSAVSQQLGNSSQELEGP